MLVKIIVVLMMLAIFGSLISALVFLLRGGKRQDQRVVKALSWRIGLSIGLFVLLMAGFYFGLIPTHGPVR
ncbi:MAG TPA: twin transmembrane helix small protein [Burkholderiales bacterium]|nr:twin transmembrane helix small protein [Burkholderiales bacterium]